MTEQRQPRPAYLLSGISRAVADGDRNLAVALVTDALAARVAPHAVLSDGLMAGMKELDALFKDGQVFLPEILISVRAMDAGLELLGPLLADEGQEHKGTVVLGTVAGDLHDIGKRLVGMLLRGNGFAVVDLGVGVEAAAFAAAVTEHQADIVALSALLTTTTPEFRHVIETLAQAGVRERVSVLVGGAPVTPALADEVGADGYADDCMRAVDEAERLLRARGRS